MESPIKFESVSDLKRAIEFNPNLQQDFKNDPVRAINKISFKNPLATDRWIYRIIVLALGLTILSIVIGIIILMSFGKITKDEHVPTILTAICSAAIGALAGLLAPPPSAPTSF